MSMTTIDADDDERQLLPTIRGHGSQNGRCVPAFVVLFPYMAAKLGCVSIPREMRRRRRDSNGKEGTRRKKTKASPT